MPRMLSPLIAGVLLLALGVRVEAQEPTARALVERAIKAQGGLEKLNRKLASHRKTKGVFHTDGFTFTGESFSEPGNRRRLILHGKTKDVPSTRVLVLDGKKGWISFDGVTRDLEPDFLDRIEKSIYADRVCGLVTLVQDRGYTLTTLGESKIKDKPALGVRVQSAGKPDVLLYFDKESGLLVKSSNRVMDANLGREVNQEVYYFDYRVLDPGKADEDLLRSANIATDGPSLLAFLRKRIPTEAEQIKMKDLILKLGHRSFAVRQKATAELKRLGIKAAAVLRQAVREGDSEVARRAGQCLQDLASDPDPAMTAAVARLIALRRPAGASEVVLAYYPWSPDEAVTRELQGALAALADVGGKQDPLLVRALKDRNLQRRAAAAGALGQDGGAYRKQGWRRIFVTGVRVATRSALYREGEHFMDLQTTEAEFFNRLDDSLFTRP